jgi:hypothetical protein
MSAERVVIIAPPPDCDVGGSWEVVEEFPLPGGDSHVRLRQGNSYFGTQRSNVRAVAAVTASRLDPDLCRKLVRLIDHLTGAGPTMRVPCSVLAVDLSAMAEQLTAAADLAAQRLESRTIGPADTAIIVEALENWDRYLTAPHADIARIRALLSSPGGGA